MTTGRLAEGVRMIRALLRWFKAPAPHCQMCLREGDYWTEWAGYEGVPLCWPCVVAITEVRLVRKS